ncbi:hypothetical protein ACJIZ3_020358 [Penstemon smallii]|uniref:Uncharacterized protein n=1 Tax=Penstemon smallii TaxID=265156 RepID=A0ABD3SID8_9LAMI
MTALACALGGDCSGLGLELGPQAIPPPPSTNGTLSLPASPLPNGSNNISKSSKKNYTWNMVLLFAMILALSL